LLHDFESSEEEELGAVKPREERMGAESCIYELGGIDHDIVDSVDDEREEVGVRDEVVITEVLDVTVRERADSFTKGVSSRAVFKLNSRRARLEVSEMLVIWILDSVAGLFDYIALVKGVLGMVIDWGFDCFESSLSVVSPCEEVVLVDAGEITSSGKSSFNLLRHCVVLGLVGIVCE
jgi:hypothetical protein